MPGFLAPTPDSCLRVMQALGGGSDGSSRGTSVPAVRDLVDIPWSQIRVATMWVVGG